MSGGTTENAAPGTALNIAYMCDRNYLPLTLVSLHSLLRHSARPMRVTLFLSDEAPEADGWVGDLGARFPHAEVSWRPIAPPVAREGFVSNLPMASYLRLRLPEFFDCRTIYLDGDTLVRGDVGELHDADLGPYAVAGVRDIVLLRAWNRQRRRLPFGPKPNYTDAEARRMKSIVDLQNYINTGVMVLGLERPEARTELQALNDLEAAMDFKQANNTTYADQDWINHRLGRRKSFLPFAWNVLGTTIPRTVKYLPRKYRAEVAAARKAPKLLHFTWRSKPYLHPAPPDDPDQANWWTWFHDERRALEEVVGPEVGSQLKYGGGG
ncbi:glycosyltransferase family 8 protein [Vannielia litorea]|uniref:Lipopolysaccharide biosynthesis protein, LPS:glycosyltransferase n=1 Tax=Vannielia litorea TaxID=1217970 RepID=A0A1N6FBB8_9RHOB|nr:glycosyltransferase [Vannielia litorea]SIN92559.1 Lipopolysaccharide biosynthesis protein, LPS:glycosyltransferase [Vannielia litorea]